LQKQQCPKDFDFTVTKLERGSFTGAGGVLIPLFSFWVTSLLGDLWEGTLGITSFFGVLLGCLWVFVYVLGRLRVVFGWFRTPKLLERAF
jgi:hypothetical protein